MRLASGSTRLSVGVLLSTIIAVALTAAVACGDDDDQPELQRVSVITASGSPNTYHGLTIAEEAGYFAEEGIEYSAQGSEGSSDALRQLIAGNFDVAFATIGATVEALEAGNLELRPVFNVFYGSIFGIVVPQDSDIQSPEDLEGKKIGVSDLAGGEVSFLRGILRTVGLSEEDVELVPLGTATAVAARAISEGEVDAIGGSVTDLTSLEVQGLDLRTIEVEGVAALPGEGVFVLEDYLENNRDVLTRFLRALAKGFQFGLDNPDAAVAIIKAAEPERFTEPELGTGIFLKFLELTETPPGLTFGDQSAESWGDFFDFVGAERPDIDLSDIVNNPDLVPEANDYDHEAVTEDALNYTE